MDTSLSKRYSPRQSLSPGPACPLLLILLQRIFELDLVFRLCLASVDRLHCPWLRVAPAVDTAMTCRESSQWSEPWTSCLARRGTGFLQVPLVQASQDHPQQGSSAKPRCPPVAPSPFTGTNSHRPKESRYGGLGVAWWMLSVKPLQPYTEALRYCL